MVTQGGRMTLVLAIQLKTNIYALFWLTRAALPANAAR
jgi:hypothetical protein